MKDYILAMAIFYMCSMCSICFAQEHLSKDSIPIIQICYNRRVGGIGGQDHCVNIYIENDFMYCQRICYSIVNHMYRLSNTELNYKEAKIQSILRHYQENNNYLILNGRVAVNKSQFDELIKIINEIKTHVPEDYNSDDIIISTSGGHSLIKEKNETVVIIDWLGRYDRRVDIERILWLNSYLRCPCVEEDLKQMNIRRQNAPVRQRIFRRSP